ncbi:hypothetical protein KVT40_005314 [Elsinoe batatas]|uniref:Uncharacterized protein n=1 Tax=Elsinoe batatas TaxID=2601811 RepID=A0A8K0PI81_9PEZI|nr:hypothetical protein KVT40_005314 [Elsinoe batatas]
MSRTSTPEPWHAEPDIPMVRIKRVDSVPQSFYVESLACSTNEAGQFTAVVSVRPLEHGAFEEKGPLPAQKQGTDPEGDSYIECMTRTDNVYMRLWREGRLFLGRFPFETDETLTFGLLRVDLDGDSHRKLTFANWFTAVGRGVEERKAFVRRVLEVVTDHKEFFD